MEENSCQSVVSDPVAKTTKTASTDANWRAELTSDVRQRIVNKIFESLKNQINSIDSSMLNRLNSVAVQFEENMFTSAASKDDYTKGIIKKMTRVENSYRQTNPTSSSNPDTIGNNSIMPNVAGFSDDVNGSIGQCMQSNVFSNTQREMSGNHALQQVYQPPQHHQLQYQLLNHNVQQPNVRPSHIQQNIHYYQQQQQQQSQQMVSQPNQLQHSQQTMLSAQPQQQLMGQQLNSTLFLCNQHYGQQSNITDQQKRLLCQQNMSNSVQQPLSPQSNISGLHQIQSQKTVETQSNDHLNLQSHQPPMSLLKQGETKASQQNVHQTSQPFQLHPLLGTHHQSNSPRDGMQQRLQMSAPMVQSQSVEQRKLLHSQRSVPPEASSASTESSIANSEPTNVGDWLSQAHLELQSVKEKFLPDLKILWEMAVNMCSRSQEPELVEKYKNNITAMEKMMKFLQMSRNEISLFPKERLDQYKMQIIRYVSTNKNKHFASLQQRGQQPQSPGGQAQAYQLQQHKNVKLQSQALNMSLVGTTVGSSPLSPTQQGIPNSPSNMISPIQHGSRAGLEQRNERSPLQHGSARSIHHSIMGTLQHTSYPNNVNISSINPLHQGSAIPNISFMQQKQQEKHQMVRVQTLKQQVQPQWYQQRKQQMLKQNVHPGVNSVMLQEHQSVGQHLEFLHLPTSTRQLHATSPQTSQQSSPQIDQQNNWSPLSRIGTPLQSANSPFVIPSPSTPLTPSSIPVDLEKQPSVVPLVIASENFVHPQTPVALATSHVKIPNQSLSIDKQGISPSPLLIESTTPEGHQQSDAMKAPFERLIKAVKSISSDALVDSIHEIGCVVNLVDTIAGRTSDTVYSSPTDENFVCKTSFHLQGSNLRSPPSDKMKRHISALAFNASSSSMNEHDSLKNIFGKMHDYDSTTPPWPKRCKIELNNNLLDEIKCINQQLVETVVDFDSTEETDEGTIIRFSYSCLILSENFKLQYTTSQMLPILPLRLRVPDNYPNSSPKILNSLAVDWRSECDGGEDSVLEKAKSRFNMALRNLSEPMSVGEMARTWDGCARAVFSEYAQRMGGDCFSSRYGSWENCVTAS